MRTSKNPVIAQSIRPAATVNNSRHVYASGNQIYGRSMRVVVIGEKRHRPARTDAPAIKVCAHCASRHNTWPVIIAKSDVPFGGACRQNRLPRNDPPKCLLWRMAVRAALKRTISAPVVNARNCRACHNPHIVHRLKLGLHIINPKMSWLAANLTAVAQQAPAQAKILIRKDHI